MNLKKDFALRQIASTWVVLPLGQETLNFDGMLTLNTSGALLWRTLEAGGDKEALVNALTAEYVVSAEQAERDVAEFLNKLIQAGCIEE